MIAAALAFLLLAGPARAQDASSATAVSTPTVSASTSPAVSVSSAPAAAPSAAPPPSAGATNSPPERAIYLRLHKESADWEPVAIRVGGDAAKARDFLSRQGAKARIKGKAVWRGHSVPVTAKARVYPVKDDRMLVVSLFPKSKDLAGLRFEVRFLVSEGYLDEVKVARVHCKDPSGRGLDSFELSAKGLDFSEDFPGSGKLTLSALNPKAGKRSLNAGGLSRAEFADADWGVVDLGFSVRGVVAGK